MKNYPKIIDTSKRKEDGSYAATNFGLSMAFSEPFMRAGDVCWPKDGGNLYVKGECFTDGNGNEWIAVCGDKDFTDPLNWRFHDEERKEDLSFEELFERFF
jgi:hypothetical protein